jgi:hypothetical protein
MAQNGFKKFLNRRQWDIDLSTAHAEPSSPNTFLSGTHSFEFEAFLEKNATIEVYLDPEGSSSGSASYVMDYTYTGAPKKFKFDVGGITEGHYNFRIEVITITASTTHNSVYIGGSFEPNSLSSGKGPYFEPVFDIDSCPIV